MLWIGITGSIGTGKSTFANILRKHGHIVLDADELAKASLEPGTNAFKKLVSALGASIVDSSGRIDRSELGRQVFSDKKKLSILESIVHPEVKLIVEQSKSEHESKNQSEWLHEKIHPSLFAIVAPSFRWHRHRQISLSVHFAIFQSPLRKWNILDCQPR